MTGECWTPSRLWRPATDAMSEDTKTATVTEKTFIARTDTAKLYDSIFVGDVEGKEHPMTVHWMRSATGVLTSNKLEISRHCDNHPAGILERRETTPTTATNASSKLIQASKQRRLQNSSQTAATWQPAHLKYLPQTQQNCCAWMWRISKPTASSRSGPKQHQPGQLWTYLAQQHF